MKKSKIFLNSCVLLGVVGCTTLTDIQNIEHDGPKINEIYYHDADDGYSVFQILNDGTILVSHPGYEKFLINYNTGIKSVVGHEKFLDMHIIPIVFDYVDEQPLKSGYYKYIGVYSYTTVENKNRKVRQFIEVKK